MVLGSRRQQMSLKWPDGDYEPWLWGFIALLFILVLVAIRFP
jgi:hypothetical protein